MNDKIIHTPQIVKNDTWLQPFEKNIVSRLHKALLTEKMLTTETGDLRRFALGHLFYGLHSEPNRWVFREWAPNATEIYFIGEFSNWKAKPEYALKKNGANWELELPINLLKHWDLYKLLVRWKGGEAERIPAYTRRVVQDEVTKIFSAQVFEPEKPYQWKYPEFKNTHKKPYIYEAHIGMSSPEEKVSTYFEFRTTILPSIIKAGYNTIQLMAVQEHPYYGSFGYHVSSFFAPSARFGTPDELKALIDEAHGAGIAVIMDLVHSHAVKNELEGLSRFDGTYYQYFHKGPRGMHPAWDSRCFDYAKPEVLHFLLSNCRYWLEEFKFDGYRFDGITSMLYLDHGLGVDFMKYEQYFNQYQDEDAITYLILANRLIHSVNPFAITVAEEMSGMPGLAAPLEQGGFGFDFRLAMGIPDYWIKLIKERKDEEWHVGDMFYELTRHRDDEQTISYAESHDQALVGDKTIIFRLIDKEMYSEMGNMNQSLVVDRGIALHKMIRLLTLATSGAGYLNFMGNEFGHPEWIDFPRVGNNWSYLHARRQWGLMDDKNLRYAKLALFDREMIKLMRNVNIYAQKDAAIRERHENKQVLAFERAGLLFVFNFNPTESFTDFPIEMEAGEYRIVLNSDSADFAGFDRVSDQFGYFTQKADEEYYAPHELKLYIPSRTALVLKKVI